MRILLLLTLIFRLNYCSAQNNIEEKIIGTWIWVAESDSFPNNTEKLSLNDSESEQETIPKITLTFKSDNSLLINEIELESNSTFKIKDSTLTMGTRKYILITIDNEKLVLKDDGGLFDKKYEYKRLIK